MAARSLANWLSFIEALNPRNIELGLDRVCEVLDRMDLRRSQFKVITVAGTNGKGSTVAICDAILRAAGYRVGAYTSPHFLQYNERVHVDGRMVSDLELCTAFERIDSARGQVPLTYFEFGTLAALDIFHTREIDVAILEVGMGGRLDAVNGVDADVAVVCAIGIDHVAWLGADRESIGREKAGIFRAQRPAVCSDPMPPASIADTAAKIGAQFMQVGRDFFVERAENGWTFRSSTRLRSGLPYPALRGDYQLFNAAGVLMALDAIAEYFPVTHTQIREGLATATLQGRFQVLSGLPVTVLDVAHNADAACAFAKTLKQQPSRGKTLAIFGMLIDKAIADVVRELSPVVDRWHVATLAAPRGATAEQLAVKLVAAGVTVPVTTHIDVASAYRTAQSEAQLHDRILVFGSFYTVSVILAGLQADTNS